MSRLSISCPNCNQTTRVDLSLNLTTQKCDRCGVRFSSVNTGLAGSRERQQQQPPDWRRTKAGEWETSPQPAASQRSPQSRTSRAAWIAVATALLVVTATAITLARRGSGSPNPVTPPMLGSGLTGSSDGALPAASNYETLRENITAATAAAQQYLAVKNIEELLPLIQNREALEKRVRFYYTEGEGRNKLPMPPFTLAPADRQIFVHAIQSVVISYETPGQVPRAVAVRQETDGRWLIDWPSAAALNEVPLTTFRSERHTQPRLFRVLATRDDYYNRSFPSDADWVCLRLEDATQEHHFFAYARRGTEAAQKALDSRLPKRGTGTPITVRLRFPPLSPSDDQVEITELIRLGWVMNDASQEPGFDLPSESNPSKKPLETGR